GGRSARSSRDAVRLDRSRRAPRGRGSSRRLLLREAAGYRGRTAAARWRSLEHVRDGGLDSTLLGAGLQTSTGAGGALRRLFGGGGERGRDAGVASRVRADARGGLFAR